MRDLRAVGVKFWHVLYPKKSTALLRECKYSQARSDKNDKICTCSAYYYEWQVFQKCIV